MVHLPVDGRVVRLRPLAGADELAVAAASGDALEAALVLLGRLVAPADEGPDDWSLLSVTDFELLLIAVRRELFGDRVLSDFSCACCGERIEMEFSIAEFAAAATPSRPRGVSDDPDRPGWRRVGAVAVRPPAVRDQIAAQRGGGEDILVHRCIDPPDAPARQRNRAVAALEAMAPEVSQTVEGVCPGCQSAVRAVFNVPGFVVAEVKRTVGRIIDEIDAIAAAYHWSEAEILALPRVRRQAYAERIRDRGLAV